MRHKQRTKREKPKGHLSFGLQTPNILNLPKSGQEIGLYVHIPFCKTKCTYCDFNTYEGIENLVPSFVDALLCELRFWGDKLDNPVVKTVFFGGGTPSYLPAIELEKIINGVVSNFQVQKEAEVTVEANPEDVTKSSGEKWLQMGINRVSLGGQSVSQQILLEMRRRHSVERIGTALDDLLSVGFNNTSLDLIFGWPTQTMSDWERSLEFALKKSPSHISLYGLEVEKSTPLHRLIKEKSLPKTNDGLFADMYLVAKKTMQAHYKQYEISNWAKEGKMSIHNLGYWKFQQYLGVGPGAHSFLDGVSYATIRSPRAYIKLKGSFEKAFLETTLFSYKETLSRKDAISTKVMLGLRVLEGFYDNDFRELFGSSIKDTFGSAIDELEEDELIVFDNANLRLSEKGLLFASEVTSRLLKAL